METLSEKQQLQLQEIKDWAIENGNQISYLTLQDMLKYEKQPITDDETVINRIVHELIEQGISVEPLVEGETYQAQAEEQEEFVPALVSIAPVTQNITNLMECLLNKEIDLSPAFQRQGDLWKNDKQSRLIESLMLRIPIPSFYFDMVNEEEWKVIDGLQRLTAFRNYLVGEESKDGKTLVKRKFVGMQYLRDFNGKTFDELPRQYIRRIKEPQEIRNAMYHGRVSELAKRLAGREEFLEATLYAVKPKRMADQEYVISFIAFTEMNYQTEYKDNDLKHIEQNFLKAMRYSREIFGRNAFRKIGDGGRRGPINKALFELFSVCFTELKEEQLDKIVEKREVFLKKYESLFQEKEFISALKSGKKTDCVKRINRGREMIKEFI